MKKLISVFICIIVVFSFSVTALAYDYTGSSRTALVNDFAELIPSADEEILNSKLENLSERYECEVAILTVNSTEGKDITAFADDYYDYNGFGFGENDDGILLVIDMGGREFATTTHGTAIDIFTDYNLLQIENAFIDDLSSGNYTDAFNAFCKKCESIFIDYEDYKENYNGENVYYPDNNYNDENVYFPDDEYSADPESSFSEIFSLKWLGTSLIIGLVIAFIYTMYLKSQLKTVRRKPSASDYVVPGSMQLTQQRDIYLYANLKKTPKPKNNSSSRSGGSSFGGGSSTHVSSSGRTHGGSRGRF